MPAKRIQIDDQLWQAISLLASERGVDLHTLADEALRDLLRKHGRPVDLRSALKQSVGGSGNVHAFPVKRSKKKPGK